jgi:hypothetical protein
VRQIFLRLVDIAVQSSEEPRGDRLVAGVPIERFESAQEQAALAILVDHKLVVSDRAPGARGRRGWPRRAGRGDGH